MAKRTESLKAALLAVPDLLIRKAFYCLLDHFKPEMGDKVPIDTFNRLLAKNIRPPGWKDVTHTNVTISQISARHERRTTQALAALPRGHNYTNGVDVECPIVIAEYQGQRLLDGNHRVNRWASANDQRLHEVIILSVDGVVGFKEHEPDLNDA
jgi:hypothetical protein